MQCKQASGGLGNLLFGKEHVDRYIATGGDDGHDWTRRAPVLMLTERVIPVVVLEWL
jgi:hypothetical protein